MTQDILNEEKGKGKAKNPGHSMEIDKAIFKPFQEAQAADKEALKKVEKSMAETFNETLKDIKDKPDIQKNIEENVRINEIDKEIQDISGRIVQDKQAAQEFFSTADLNNAKNEEITKHMTAYFMVEGLHDIRTKEKSPSPEYTNIYEAYEKLPYSKRQQIEVKITTTQNRLSELNSERENIINTLREKELDRLANDAAIRFEKLAKDNKIDVNKILEDKEFKKLFGKIPYNPEEGLAKNLMAMSDENRKIVVNYVSLSIETPTRDSVSELETLKARLNKEDKGIIQAAFALSDSKEAQAIKKVEETLIDKMYDASVRIEELKEKQQDLNETLKSVEERIENNRQTLKIKFNDATLYFESLDRHEKPSATRAAEYLIEYVTYGVDFESFSIDKVPQKENEKPFTKAERKALEKAAEIYNSLDDLSKKSIVARGTTEKQSLDEERQISDKQKAETKKALESNEKTIKKLKNSVAKNKADLKELRNLNPRAIMDEAKFERTERALSSTNDRLSEEMDKLKLRNPAESDVLNAVLLVRTDESAKFFDSFKETINSELENDTALKDLTSELKGMDFPTKLNYLITSEQLDKVLNIEKDKMQIPLSDDAKKCLLLALSAQSLSDTLLERPARPIAYNATEAFSESLTKKVFERNGNIDSIDDIRTTAKTFTISDLKNVVDEARTAPSVSIGEILKDKRAPEVIGMMINPSSLYAEHFAEGNAFEDFRGVRPDIIREEIRKEMDLRAYEKEQAKENKANEREQKSQERSEKIYQAIEDSFNRTEERVLKVLNYFSVDEEMELGEGFKTFVQNFVPGVRHLASDLKTSISSSIEKGIIKAEDKDAETKDAKDTDEKIKEDKDKDAETKEKKEKEEKEIKKTSLKEKLANILNKGMDKLKEIDKAKDAFFDKLNNKWKATNIYQKYIEPAEREKDFIKINGLDISRNNLKSVSSKAPYIAKIKQLIREENEKQHQFEALFPKPSPELINVYIFGQEDLQKIPKNEKTIQSQIDSMKRIEAEKEQIKAQLDAIEIPLPEPALFNITSEVRSTRYDSITEELTKGTEKFKDITKEELVGKYLTKHIQELNGKPADNLTSTEIINEFRKPEYSNQVVEIQIGIESSLEKYEIEYQEKNSIDVLEKILVLKSWQRTFENIHSLQNMYSFVAPQLIAESDEKLAYELVH